MISEEAAGEVATGSEKERPVEASRKEMINKVLGVRTPEAAPDPVDTDKAFYREYRITGADLGSTPDEILMRLKSESQEPDELDEEILDQLLFTGGYQREYKMGKKGSFVLRTISPAAMSRSESALGKVIGENEDPTIFAVKATMVARSLDQINGRRIDSTDGSQEAFESEEALMERIRYVLSMQTVLVDTIGDRLNAFIVRVKRATEKSISTF